MKNFKFILVTLISLTLIMKISTVLGEHDHKNEEHDHEEHEEHGEEAIELSQESQELGGIKTQKVKSYLFLQKINVTGRVAQDVEEVEYVYPSENGIVKESKTHLGRVVQKDETLCTIETGNQKIIEIKAPIAGTIISEFVKKGERVDQMTTLYAIADFSKLSANFDVYEKDIGKVKVGQKVIIYSMAYPDQTLSGEIVFISPRVEETTFTIKIKVEIDNQNNLLKLGMPVRAEVLVENDQVSIVVPAQAVQTVEGKTVIFKVNEEGAFEPQEVVISSLNKDSAVIKEGLKENDEIVIAGSFILKSKMLESEMEHGHSH